jgi:hypothetical protein
MPKKSKNSEPVKTLQIRSNDLVGQVEGIAEKSGLSSAAVFKLVVQHGLPIVANKLTVLAVDMDKK